MAFQQKFVPDEEIARQKEYINLLKNESMAFVDKNGRQPAVFINTFGCQMNENDSEKIAGVMGSAGYVLANDRKDADLIILNTCCVRENAENKVYGHLGAMKSLKEANPDLVIAVCGCMVKQAHVVEHIKKTYRHVDILLGNGNQYRFPELIYKVITEKVRVFASLDDDTEIAEGFEFKRRYTVKAYVTAMYGCNNFCSYCVVPYVRGRERSRTPEAIIDEIAGLADNGCKEIMILGQNVNSYGKTLDNPVSFANLLERVSEVDGIERIRFMTSHPKDISDNLIDCFGKLPKLEYHLHLPLQSGSSKVLHEMNRHYDAEGYKRIIDKVKTANPGIGLTTDIIVGFPGETEEDFEETLNMVKFAEFDSSFTFIYSRREETKAAARLDQIDEAVKSERFNRLLEVQNEISLRNNKRLEGNIEKVLVEGLSRENDSIYTGRTSSNHIVNFKACENDIGQMKDVKITKALTWSLEGELAND